MSRRFPVSSPPPGKRSCAWRSSSHSDEVPFLQLVDITLECRRCERLGVFAANFPLHVLMQGLRLVFRAESSKRTQNRDILDDAFACEHVAERKRTS